MWRNVLKFCTLYMCGNLYNIEQQLIIAFVFEKKRELRSDRFPDSIKTTVLTTISTRPRGEVEF